MSPRILIIVLALVCALTSSGCAIGPTTRHDEASAQFILLVFPSAFPPRLIAFHEATGRWPRDMDEFTSFASIGLERGARQYFERCMLVPQPDGSLEIELPGAGSSPHRVRVSVPVSSKKPNKAPEPTPRPVTDRAGARSAPGQVVAHL